MSGKHMVIIFLAVLVGSLASAAAIRYVAPVGQLVLTAPTRDTDSGQAYGG